MKICHSIHFRVFCREDEDYAKIKEGLSFLAPFDYEKEKIKISEQNAQGFGEKRIKIIEIVLDKERHISEWIEFILEKLSREQKDILMRQVDSRLDDECCFFIRFDKEDILRKQFFITDSGSCYHVKMCIAAFPKNKENAKVIIEEMLK